MSAVALCTISQEHCTGEVGGSRKGREIRKCWVTREGTTLTKKPPPFRLASLLHRKPQTFPAPTHQRKSHTLSGQTEPRNRKSRKHRKSGVARKSTALAGFRVSRKGRRYRKSGVSRQSRHWRARGSVWPVIASGAREGGGCRKCGLLLARAGRPNGMEVG